MYWALIAHPGHYLKGQLVQTPELVAEACVPTAMAQGWIVLALDSDVPPLPKHRVDWRSLQSNPRRIPRRDHGMGYTEET